MDSSRSLYHMTSLCFPYFLLPGRVLYTYNTHFNIIYETFVVLIIQCNTLQFEKSASGPNIVKENL